MLPALQDRAPARPAAEREGDVDPVTDVLERIKDKLGDSREPAVEAPSVEQAIVLREQAPELYDLWLKIAQEKAATANYVDRAPYEVPERLAQSGRPRALGALIVVLSFCGYLAWLGGPGPYIGGLIAILDLIAMLAVLFALRPDRLAEPGRAERRRRLPRPGLVSVTCRLRGTLPHLADAWARAPMPGALHCCSRLGMEGVGSCLTVSCSWTRTPMWPGCPRSQRTGRPGCAPSATG